MMKPWNLCSDVIKAINVYVNNKWKWNTTMRFLFIIKPQMSPRKFNMSWLVGNEGGGGSPWWSPALWQLQSHQRLHLVLLLPAFLNCHHPTLHLTSDFALCFEGYLRGVDSLLRCEVSCSFGLWAGCSGMQAVMQSCRGALRVEKGQKRRGHAVTEGIGTPGMYL